ASGEELFAAGRDLTAGFTGAVDGADTPSDDECRRTLSTGTRGGSDRGGLGDRRSVPRPAPPCPCLPPAPVRRRVGGRCAGDVDGRRTRARSIRGNGGRFPAARLRDRQA